MKIIIANEPTAASIPYLTSVSMSSSHPNKIELTITTQTLRLMSIHIQKSKTSVYITCYNINYFFRFCARSDKIDNKSLNYCQQRIYASICR